MPFDGLSCHYAITLLLMAAGHAARGYCSADCYAIARRFAAPHASHYFAAVFSFASLLFSSRWLSPPRFAIFSARLIRLSPPPPLFSPYASPAAAIFFRLFCCLRRFPDDDVDAARAIFSIRWCRRRLLFRYAAACAAMARFRAIDFDATIFCYALRVTRCLRYAPPLQAARYYAASAAAIFLLRHFAAATFRQFDVIRLIPHHFPIRFFFFFFRSLFIFTDIAMLSPAFSFRAAFMPFAFAEVCFEASLFACFVRVLLRHFFFPSSRRLRHTIFTFQRHRYFRRL